MKGKPDTPRLRIRVTKDDNAITCGCSRGDPATWQPHAMRIEATEMHQNVFGGFLGLNLGGYNIGECSVRMSRFSYRTLAACARLARRPAAQKTTLCTAQGK
ncbi:hypothetical protein [Massilia sp. DD77]|uniref:hypothetical protein n=1 Tax=Massilia sp. DD77 TaxID=3109349 RepID=UPI003000F393